MLGQYSYLRQFLALVNSIPFWLVLAEIECTAHVALPKRPINKFKPDQQRRKLALRAYYFKIYTLSQAQYFLREFKVVSTIKKLNSSFHFGRVARRKTTQLAQNERGRKISQNRNIDFMKSYLNPRTPLEQLWM